MPASSARTPMFRQYESLKKHHPDAILLFRMGDFYEMFYQDAKVASGLLELTLTARGKGTDQVVPMCGFPHHQLEAYTARLVKADRRVAICDQVEDPRQAKGLVRREVVRVVTPGTFSDPDQLDSRVNHWIAAIGSESGRLAAAFLDLSTGEFLTWDSRPGDDGSWVALADLLRGFAPREIVHSESFGWSETFRRDATAGAVLTPIDAYAFAPTAAESLLARHFDVASLDGYGLRERPAAIGAAGALLQYVQETQKCGLEHINRIRLHEPSDYLLLDPATRRNLELTRSLRDGGRDKTLIDALDETVTPGGGRLLRRWLLAPLLDVERIGQRQDAVAELLERAELRRRVRERLGGVRDVERLLARAVAGTAGARDLLGLRTSLLRLPALLQELSELTAGLVRAALDGVDPCGDVAERLARGLVDDPPATLRDGGVIREGFHAELDELRAIRRDGKATIASIEAAERERTGIASLRVKYNKVFGYFIEVSKANLHRVPTDYDRKQTITSGERFVTPQLKEYEARVLNAQERIESLEQELFRALRAEVASHAARLQTVARAVSLIDLLAALAEIAQSRGYCRPRVDAGGSLRIVGGRHPVVELNTDDEPFVANDTQLIAAQRAVAVLTGPNMGGKSTYLRQVALIVLLAQTGSFVPASEVELGIVDRIFCRVGASDSLAEGQSTFMVEMSETANILHHATSRSLVLLDEIGRGTSTFDGLSIAWAVVEQLDAREGGAPRTLFATHYHELTELAGRLDSVVNLRMAVREWGDRVVFLHRVEEGAADRSYGIHVARLAGVPHAVVERAAEILASLEREEEGRSSGTARRVRRPSEREEAERRGQRSMFGPPPAGALAGGPEAEVLETLRGRETDRMTPLQALELLAELRRKLLRPDEAGESGSGSGEA